MIGFYGLLVRNKAMTKVLSLAITHILDAHLCNQYNHVFPVLIFMIHVKCINLYQTSLIREKDFTCKKCIPGVLFEDEDKMITLDGDNIEVVDRFF